MISVNLTVHDKDFLLPQVLNRISLLTTGSYELVIVLDGCTDKSADVVDLFRQTHPRLKTKVLTAPNVFETKANNLAARASEGDHVIIVQDDTLLDELGWNERLLKPFHAFSDVFAVTSCAAHNWKLNPKSQDVHDDVVRDHRWCDILDVADRATYDSAPRDLFQIRDTVNRSPLAINRADLETMGYFDEAFAPQDCDDHDLMYRMHAKLGKVCGLYPIKWRTQPEWGGTRDAQGRTATWLLVAHHKNMRLLYERHRAAIATHRVESRPLP